MRTFLLIVGGIMLWAILTALINRFSNQLKISWRPTVIFAIIWFMITSWNIWVGVTQAGYTFIEELPVFLLTYLLPLTIAVVAKIKSTS